jgi:hypothetical protein
MKWMFRVVVVLAVAGGFIGSALAVERELLSRS